MLEEEGVETVVEIGLEILGRRHIGENLAHDVFVVVQDLITGVGLEMIACLQVDEFTE